MIVQVEVEVVVETDILEETANNYELIFKIRIRYVFFQHIRVPVLKLSIHCFLLKTTTGREGDLDDPARIRWLQVSLHNRPNFSALESYLHTFVYNIEIVLLKNRLN
jgi:hypothetical protein